MSWAANSPRPSCDVCGRYISMADVLEGNAVHRMVTPDSDISMEEWETLCRHHTPERKS